MERDNGRYVYITMQNKPTACLSCGQEIQQSGKGRTREYCSANCKDVMTFWNAFITRSGAMNLTPEAKAQWKQRLFQESNTYRVAKVTEP